MTDFLGILNARARGKKVVLAQRHKRKNTVFDKLLRQPEMSLARMDDIAGCRLIFPSIQTLHKYRNALQKENLGHRLKNPKDKYDYIFKPKKNGYRGIHDVYEYCASGPTGKYLSGLFVEVQYRTYVQHAWATANEVLSTVTDSQPKFDKGDERILQAMKLASEILARAHESSKGPLPTTDDKTLVKEFIRLDKELDLIKTLRSLHPNPGHGIPVSNVILIYKKTPPELDIRDYATASDAINELFQIENDHPDWDVVLVRAASAQFVRTAFKNYFSDVRDFIDLIEKGCSILAQSKKRSFLIPAQHLNLPGQGPQYLAPERHAKGPRNKKQWWSR